MTDIHPASGTADLIAGGAAIAGLYRPTADDAAAEAVAAAWTFGVRAFDTAPHYGIGRSERILGEFLRDRPRDSFTIETKIGRVLVPDPSVVDDDDHNFFGTGGGLRRLEDYTADGVKRSLTGSLERLGLDRVDHLLVHDPEHHMATALGEVATTLSGLRDEGVIASWGVGTNFVDVATAFVEHTDADRVLIAGRSSLLDRRAEPLLARAAERHVDVAVAGVFNGGLLLGRAAGAPMFDYTPAPEPLRAAADAMEAACARHRVSLRAAALQLPRHAGAAFTVLGCGTAAEFTDTLDQLAVEIPPDLWAELDTLVPDQSLLPD